MTSTRSSPFAIESPFWSTSTSKLAQYPSCCRTSIRGFTRISTDREGARRWCRKGSRGRFDAMETRANYVVVGTFVLVVIVGAFASIIWLFGQNVREEAGGYYDIYFSGSVVGLGRDSKVRMSGVDIGLVREVRLRETGLVRVNVQIEKQYLANIRQDSVAELASESFVTAIPYIEISPGSSGAPALEPSGEQRSQIPS